ncbi:MAG: glycosyltransferase family 4 protein [Jatrophihabitantaceae bacterium]
MRTDLCRVVAATALCARPASLRWVGVPILTQRDWTVLVRGNAMPRILVAHPSADVYGSDLQMVESLNALSDAGWDVTLCLPGTGPLVDLVKYAQVRIEPFPVLRKALLRPWPLLLALLRTPRDVVRLTRRIHSARPDVVFVNTVTLPWWAMAARLAHVPLLVHVHEAEELSAPLVRRLLYTPLKIATTVIANSDTTRRVLTDSVPALAPRIVTVPNGLPDPGYEPLDRARPGRLVLVSRLSPRKGVEVAIDAVAQLRRAGRDVELHIAGDVYPGYEWFARQLRTQARAPELGDAVRFLGYVSPTAPLLASANVVLAPSLGESFGNAAAEAMLARRPLVASNVQGLAEMIDDGRTGVLVPVGDAGAIAQAVARFLDEPAWAAQVAGAARDEAEKRFSVVQYRAEIAAAVSAASAAVPGE